MSGNTILAQIPAVVRAAQHEAFAPVDLKAGQELTVYGAIPQHLYFLHSGIAQGFVEIGDEEAGGPLLGRFDLIGEAAILGCRPATATTVMLTSGAGVCVATHAILAMTEQTPAVRSALYGAVWSALRDLQQDAARVHRLSKAACLAHVLLAAEALLDSPTIPLTHEALARSICSHRPLVTVALQAFEQRGLVRNTRGRVEIRDRGGLSAVADGHTPIKVREAA